MKQSLLIILLLVARVFSADATGLRLVQSIPLPDVEGRIDHLVIDVAGQQLFVAALGNNSVEVVDLHTGKPLHRLGGMLHPQGVAWISDRNQLFVASGQDATVKVFDGKSYRLESTLEGLDDADNVRYDARAKLVYVGYGDGALAVIEAATRKRVGDIRLSGHPESFQLERNGPRIFVNVPAAKDIAVIDREKLAVIDTWPVEQAAANFPMALDEEKRRLFVACRKPATLLALNTDSGQTIMNVPIDGDADDVFYDARRNRVYISCGAGVLDVLDADGLKVREKIPTAAGARTSLLTSELNRLYLAVPYRGNQPAEVRVYEVTGD